MSDMLLDLARSTVSACSSFVMPALRLTVLGLVFPSSTLVPLLQLQLGGSDLGGILHRIGVPCSPSIFGPQIPFHETPPLSTSVPGHSVPIDLKAIFDVKAVSSQTGGFGDFDGNGMSFPSEFMPVGKISWDGIEFALPDYTLAGNDSVKASGQQIPTPKGRYFSFHALVSVNGDGDPISDRFNLTYSDRSTDSLPFTAQSCCANYPSVGAITAPFYYQSLTESKNRTAQIFAVSVRTDPSKTLESFTLPTRSDLSGSRRIHVFAVSLYTFNTTTIEGIPKNTDPRPPKLSVQSVRSTTNFVKSSKGETIQSVHIALNNVGSSTSGDVTGAAEGRNFLDGNYRVILKSDSINTVNPARIRRLGPNDQARLQVGIVNAKGIKVGSPVTVSVVIEDERGNDVFESGGWEIKAGIPEYNPSLESVALHESADWFNGAKFGIFVHWGVYSVPAWAPVGVSYSEWYWRQQHSPEDQSSPTWAHHLETYGPDFVYDDFIPSFGHGFNATALVEIFAQAGARYFVLTTKHHDGYSLFDTGSTSDRNSIKLSPGRDLVQDVFDAAEKHFPDIHRGLYYSMPEWFHPDYEPYGTDAFPGRLPDFPYNHTCCEPFTGYVKVDDFLQDLQGPQMEILMHKYNTEILWCDIGGASAFPSIGWKWFNAATAQNRSVVVNNRCGASFSDYDTPEYATFPTTQACTGFIQERKWESSEGMDPRSYGYNAATPDYMYRNATGIIATLVDIVSKNGNYLLDIGPDANGTVIPAMTDRLKDVGKWLSVCGEAIFDTAYWFVTPEHGEIRFTTTTDAFYIISLEEPHPEIAIPTNVPIPILDRDKVYLLGGSGKALDWRNDEDGFSISVPEDEVGLVEHAWAFKVEYARA